MFRKVVSPDVSSHTEGTPKGEERASGGMAAKRDAKTRKPIAKPAIQQVSIPTITVPSTRACRTFRPHEPAKRRRDRNVMSVDFPNASGLAALSALCRFARPRPVRERCELCDAGLADEHAHLLELANRNLVCACDACAILFDNREAGKYRRVPRRVQFLADFRLADETWEALHLPIDLAFFLHSTAAGRVVALYPSPAGATESLVPLEAWQTLAGDNPILHQLEPDVEALLVNRIGGTREYYRARHRPLLQAGWLAAYPLARSVRRHGGMGSDRRVSSPRCEEGHPHA